MELAGGVVERTVIVVSPPGGGGGGYSHIWAKQVCAAVKGMVFKQFTLAYGI